MAANKKAGHGLATPPDCRRDRTPRTLLRCEHGAAIATAIARSMAAPLVVLMVDDHGVLVAGSDKAVDAQGIADRCGQLLARAQSGCDFALLVSLDSAFDPAAEVVRQAWHDTRRRFADAGIELGDWLLVSGAIHVSMEACGKEEEE